MNFATLDLNLLRVLDAVLREGSTTKAGERLGLTQSAVSNALNRLRGALNDPLFVRQGNQLVPTDFAASIEDGLRQELARLEGLLSPAVEFDPLQAKGTFKIAASDFFAELLMPDWQPSQPNCTGDDSPVGRSMPHNYVESLDRTS